QRREIALDEFYETWKRKIYAQEQTNDQVYMEIRKETKEMIKKMRENHEARGFSEEDIYESEREIIWRSKAVYVKANKIIKDIGRSIYSLTFCGNELHIDVFSLIHILFRHYAELTKPHNDNKSHFSEIPPELLMESLYNILLKIEKSGHLKTDDMPVDIFFEYYRQLYRIYFKKVKKSEKNRGLYEIYRVNTWYPVEAEKDIKDAENLTAKKVGKWLDVWI
ncbi:MAG TPA: hypothetical protein PKC40_12260, partial [Saprospiraceae bacterium]|nr:hypothetical protein [Saprospiraceae bacterium]